MIKCSLVDRTMAISGPDVVCVCACVSVCAFVSVCVFVSVCAFLCVQWCLIGVTFV